MTKPLEAPKKTSQRRLFLRKKLCFTPKTGKKPLKTPPAVDYRDIFDQKKYAGKEPDHETGLYYYGSRYLDPKTSRWLSGDPALGDYLPTAPLGDEEKKRNGNLPGQGGIFNTVNMHLYHYAGNNPVKYTDPDGRSDIDNIASSIHFNHKSGVRSLEIKYSDIKQEPWLRTLEIKFSDIKDGPPVIQLNDGNGTTQVIYSFTFNLYQNKNSRTYQYFSSNRLAIGVVYGHNILRDNVGPLVGSNFLPDELKGKNLQKYVYLCEVIWNRQKGKLEYIIVRVFAVDEKTYELKIIE